MIIDAVRPVLVFALAVAAASGQSVVDPARISASLKSFERRADDRPLRCDVAPIRPRLNFNFRLEAGYVVRVPMSQYSGPGHGWGVLARITPQGGNRQPVYLANRVRLPSVPPTRVIWETGGFYVLGEGRYHVSWQMFDDIGRVCRKEWDINAKLGGNERHVKVTMPPYAVTDMALRGVAVVHEADDVAPLRLTVLLHAAPLIPRRTRLAVRDRFMLLSTLSSLLERVPARFVRLVLFNLAQQKELYRQEDFRLESLGDVAQALEGVQLQTVDYRVLRNRTGYLDLITDLVNREVSAQPTSDVVVFLGPEAPYSDKLRRGQIETLQGAATGGPGGRPEGRPGGTRPRFLYLQYRLPVFQQATLADCITRAVAGVKGKTVVIHTPGEFARAIEQIERR